ncbi:hypothetical protein PV380_02475 [Streptomyces caniscabiei]|uniref:hypothetical protein n=1 Tax=Streptomyces sp. FxanaA7 TaxID=1265492 RepID=UPI00131BEB81|nr:hypothetical protein [Streptomyces sp. FxanaA7]MDX2949604.1 hypothetical protein [Streptomyces caniscabiei]
MLDQQPARLSQLKAAAPDPRAAAFAVPAAERCGAGSRLLGHCPPGQCPKRQFRPDSARP